MALAYLRPVSTFASAWAGAATDVDDDFFDHDEDTTSIIWDSVNDSQALFDLSAMPSAAVINSVSIYAVTKGDNSTTECRPLFRIDGVTYTGTYNPQNGTYGYNAPLVYTEHPATGNPLTTADLNGAIAGVSARDVSGAVDSIRCTMVSVVVDYVALPAPIGAARDVASRYLQTFRRPVSIVNVTVPLRWADVEIGDTIRLSHFAGETPDDEGWGYKVWEGRLFVVLASEIDLDNLRVNLRLFDLRDYLTSFWDTAISEEAPSVFSHGIARLDTGATRTYSRDGSAFVENAAVAAQGSIQVSEVGDDIEKQDTNGLLIEAEGTNFQVQSSFVNGETGWTSTGEGSNGSSIDLDTDDLLFDADITSNSLQFTGGNPIHVSDLQVTGTATSSIVGSSLIRVSFDHKDDNGSPLMWTLQRGSSNYWSEASAAWTTAKTWNPMDTSLTPSRQLSSQINIGSTDYTLTAGIGISTTGVAGQINHLYHTQIEVNRYATSRIVCSTTSAATRNMDDLSISDSLHKRVWPVEQGTAWFQVIPEWNTSDIAANKSFFHVQYNAANQIRVIYLQSASQVIFRHRIGAVTYDATYTVNLTRGQLYTIAARWCGAEGEHGLDPYTLSVFVDGVKGTDVVAVPWGSLVADATLYWGQDQSNTIHADSFFRHVRVTPFVLTDEEIADLP